MRWCWPVLLLVLPASATAGVLDLNDFYADPSVTVAADGSWAILAEDISFMTVLLSNDPGLGDPNVVIPGPNVILSFTYLFAEGVGEDDEFGAFVLDGATGLSVGPAYEFFTQDSSGGTVAFNLTPLQGMTLGLQFELNALFDDTGLLSTASVSDVRLTQIPEPSAWALFAAGAGLLLLARSRFPRRAVSKGE